MNSTILSSGKCMKCGKYAPVSELDDNPAGIGNICADIVKCNQHLQKLKESSPMGERS